MFVAVPSVEPCETADCGLPGDGKLHGRSRTLGGCWWALMQTGDRVRPAAFAWLRYGVRSPFLTLWKLQASIEGSDRRGGRVCLWQCPVPG